LRGPLNSVAILFNPRVADAHELAHALSTLVEQRGIGVAICEGETEEQMSAGIPSATDLLITLGGDGTLLRTAHFAASREIPILGVNLGKLGFLCDIGPNRALEDVPVYLEGHYEMEERMMLKVIHSHRGQALSTKHALNDAVVGHASVASIIRVRASVNGNHLTTFAADGVIVATPSGSTAYSFAAGGPIVHPADRQLLLTPISPHKPRFGSFVAPVGAVISLKVESVAPAVLSVDGGTETPVGDGDVIEVCKSEYITRLLRRDSERYFFQALRSTLKYGLES